MSREDAALLQSTPLFGGMPVEALERIAEKAIPGVRRDEVIFREEDAGKSLWYRDRGLIKVYRSSPTVMRWCWSRLARRASRGVADDRRRTAFRVRRGGRGDDVADVADRIVRGTRGSTGTR